MATIKCKNLTFTNIQAIFFDKDGTLEDSQASLRLFGQETARLINAQFPGIGESLLVAFGINGDSLDPAGIMAVTNRWETEVATATCIVQTGQGWFKSLAIARFALNNAEKYIEKVPSPLFVGCDSVIKNLSEAGLKIGILSAAPTKNVDAFVKTNNLSSYIHLSMGSDGGISKPDPAFFLQACKSLKVEPNATLMVGDSVGDIEMARNAKAAGCIGITWIGKSENVKGADVVINQLDEIQIVES